MSGPARRRSGPRRAAGDEDRDLMLYSEGERQIDRPPRTRTRAVGPITVTELRGHRWKAHPPAWDSCRQSDPRPGPRSGFHLPIHHRRPLDQRPIDFAATPLATLSRGCTLRGRTEDVMEGNAFLAAPEIGSPESGANGLAAFIPVRPRLFGIAYRMLGSAAEAEDIVQEVWLRWR